MMKFWIRTEVLDHVLIPFTCSSWFSFEILSKYAKKYAVRHEHKRKLPLISLKAFEKICSKHLQNSFTKQHAKTYFEHFRIVLKGNQYSKHFESISTQSDEDEYPHFEEDEEKEGEDGGESVLFYPFAVFLLLHNCFNEKSCLSSPNPRSTRSMSNPSSPFSPNKENSFQGINSQFQHGIPSPSYSNESNHHISFIKRHAIEILHLISPLQDRIKRRDFDLLDFLFRGGRSFNVAEELLSSSTPFWQSSLPGKGYHKKDILEWMTNNMQVVDPEIKSNLETKKVESPSYFQSAVHLPLAFTVENQIRTTVLKTDKQLKGSPNVKIENCHQSQIYLLAQTEYVSISNCTSCTIVIGTCDRVIHLHNCSDLKLVTVTKGIRASSSSNCTFYLCTATCPVILPKSIPSLSFNLLPSKEELKSSKNCSGLVFAPYNSHYPLLKIHMEEIGINGSLSKNLWNSPLLLSHQFAPSVDKENVQLDRIAERIPTFSLLKSSDFTIFNIPLVVNDARQPNPSQFTLSNPVELPVLYQNAVREAQNVFNGFQDKVTQLAQVKQMETKEEIENAFWDWLKKTGKLREIQDLSRLETFGEGH
eukprot:TRINITY_DN3369_c0_g1_i1.p1 TRINITY_DN3369_c0_g1~~TRINITY_DN3369_c0_g1_i1.p1  ORF type:complete len:590 (+),score=192.80 TRINITY_DN3369_c0_g1_i1:72-1841(+)